MPYELLLCSLLCTAISMSSFADKSPANKLYVTVGPQCAGKTTFLSQIPGAIDVAMDDQKGTYEAVSTRTVLELARKRG